MLTNTKAKEMDLCIGRFEYLNDFGLDESDILLKIPKLSLFVLISNANKSSLVINWINEEPVIVKLVIAMVRM